MNDHDEPSRLFYLSMNMRDFEVDQTHGFIALQTREFYCMARGMLPTHPPHWSNAANEEFPLC